MRIKRQRRPRMTPFHLAASLWPYCGLSTRRCECLWQVWALDQAEVGLLPSWWLVYAVLSRDAEGHFENGEVDKAGHLRRYDTIKCEVCSKGHPSSFSTFFIWDFDRRPPYPRPHQASGYNLYERAKGIYSLHLHCGPLKEGEEDMMLVAIGLS
jgi:hypothetical protein